MNIFTFIKTRLTILDVIGEYMTLKRAGTYWKAQCPFHHEKTASFTVSPHKEIFYCFGCHATGDIISFIAKMENCSLLEAAQFLTQRYNISLPAQLMSEVELSDDTKDKNHYFMLCMHLAQWCNEQLLKSPRALQYFTKRGITKNSIETFLIGYFPGGKTSIKLLVEYLKKHNLLVHDLIKTHILSESKTVLFSPFEERLMFPIKDLTGHFCGFGGRIFKEGDERPKYYNSRENDYFTKGSLLFGLDLAKKSIQEKGYVFLVEGYTDCIIMAQYGFTNTVATLGTACSIQHLKLISRYANYVYILYDGDSAGQQAVVRLAELCWQVNLELKVISLPAGLDPASFLTGGHNLQPLIEQAADIFMYFIAVLGTEFNQKSLQEKVQIIRRLLDAILSVGNDLLKQDILLQTASKTFNVPYPTLKEELTRRNNIPQKSSAQLTEKVAVPDEVLLVDSPSELEKRIFCAIINNVQLFNKCNEKNLLEYMPNPLGDILKKLQEYMQVNSGKTFTFVSFFDMLDEDGKRYISKLILQRDESVDSAIFEHLLVELHKKYWKKIVYDIKTKLAQAHAEGDEQKKQKIMRDFLELKQKVASPLTKPLQQ